MAATIDQHELAAMLKGVGLFSRCGDGERLLIAAKVELREMAEGDKIIGLGDEGSDLFLLLEGTADAVSDGEVRKGFGPGDYFGELAALAPAPRTSDVVATAPTRVAVLSRGNVYLLVNSVPGVAAKMLEGLATTLRDSIQAG